jgi:hypothetical protein
MLLSLDSKNQAWIQDFVFFQLCNNAEAISHHPTLGRGD